MMRRVRAARYVIDEPRLGGRELLQLLHVLDRLVGHGCGQVPAGMALEGENRCRVAEQVRLPLARITADEAVEVIEAMPVGHWLKGPAWLFAKNGVLWSLPNHEVAYPLSFSMVPMVPFSMGMIES
jgi:hypothetical protein